MGVERKSKYRVLVEGVDDCHALLQLLCRHGVKFDASSFETPHFQNCGGITELLSLIPLTHKTYGRYAVIADANSEPETRWQQLRRKFGDVGVSISDAPNPDGVVVPHEGKTIGIWMMPNNEDKGALEEFLVDLVPDGDRSWPYAERAVGKAMQLGAQIDKVDRLKARMHTWLAWQKEPGRPYGIAVKSKYFNHESPTALKFVNWFKGVFC